MVGTRSRRSEAEAFLPAARVAALLGVTPDTVTRWCREGRLPGVKPGRDWRIPRGAVEALAARAGARRHLGLARRAERLRPGAHALVLVPGTAADARRLAGPGAVSGEPPRPGPGGPFSGAVWTAARRSRAAQQAAAVAAGGSRLMRWASAFLPDAPEEEARIGEAARRAGARVLCLLPLSPTPPALGRLVEAHTHLLVEEAPGAWRAEETRARGG